MSDTAPGDRNRNAADAYLAQPQVQQAIAIALHGRSTSAEKWVRLKVPLWCREQHRAGYTLTLYPDDPATGSTAGYAVGEDVPGHRKQRGVVGWQSAGADPDDFMQVETYALECHNCGATYSYQPLRLIQQALAATTRRVRFVLSHN